MAGARDDPLVHHLEDTREPQIRDHDHHAEKQHDRLEIDRLKSLLEREHA